MHTNVTCHEDVPLYVLAYVYLQKLFYGAEQWWQCTDHAFLADGPLKAINAHTTVLYQSWIYHTFILRTNTNKTSTLTPLIHMVFESDFDINECGLVDIPKYSECI